jgi:hypothetical protein
MLFCSRHFQSDEPTIHKKKQPTFKDSKCLRWKNSLRSDVMNANNSCQENILCDIIYLKNYEIPVTFWGYYICTFEMFWDKREYSIAVADRLDSACSWLDMYTWQFSVAVTLVVGVRDCSVLKFMKWERGSSITVYLVKCCHWMEKWADT